MAYIVLARKWRPKSFGDVVGQEHVTQTLVNAIRQGRLAHAFIFAGPRGVGKTSVARLLARAVNLENPAEELDTLGTQGPEGAAPLDLIEIDGASNRGIDEIRNLRENIRFAPVSSTYKVYIIDEIHMLSKEAFNALLKTLEEPPSHAIFIFATTEIHRVPATILSRCQRYDFKRLTTVEIADQLEKIATSENIPIDRDSLLLIARMADGGMRDATSIMDQMASFSSGPITVDLVQRSLGIIDEAYYFECTDLLRKRDDAAIIAYVQRVVSEGHDLPNFLQGMQVHLRNLMVTRANGSARLLEVADHLRERYEADAPHYEVRDLLQYLDLVTAHDQTLKYSEHPQLILELLLLKIAHKPRSMQLEELLKLLRNNPPAAGGAASGGTAPPAPGSGGGASRGGPAPSAGSSPTGGTGSSPAGPPSNADRPRATAPAPEKSGADRFAALKKVNLPGKHTPTAPDTTPSPAEAGPPAPPAPPPSTTLSLSLEAVQARWPAIIEAVRQSKIALGSFLEDGVPYAIEGDAVVLAFDAKTGFHMEHVTKNAPTIEAVMAEHLGGKARLSCVRVDFAEKGLTRQVESPEERFQKLKDQEPVLRKLIELFDCEQLDD